MFKKLIITCLGLSLPCAAQAGSVTYNSSTVINHGGTVTIGGVDAADAIKGSGVKTSDTRTLEGFKAIDITIGADVTILAGAGMHEAIVTGDDNIVPFIETEVKNGWLIIKTTSNYSAKVALEIEVSVEQLNALELLGSGDIELSGLQGESFAMSLKGSGDVEATGEVKSLGVNLTGSGDLFLKELKAEDVSLKVLGSGDTYVYASESVDVKLTGSGDARVYGRPLKVTQKQLGSGDIIMED